MLKKHPTSGELTVFPLSHSPNLQYESQTILWTQSRVAAKSWYPPSRLYFKKM